MNEHRKPGKINVKAVVILLAIVVVLGAAAVVGRDVRRRIIAGNALAAAKTALQEEDWVEASKQLSRYLNRNRDDVAMLEEYARANLKVRPQEAAHVRAAMDAYVRLLREKPGDADYSHKLADLYNQTGRYADAEQVCQRRLEVDPADAKAQLALGLARFRLTNFDGATEVLTGLAKTHPDQVQAYAVLASVALERGDPSGQTQAGQWLDKGVELNPQSAAAWIHRARFRREKQDDAAGARDDLERAAAAPVATPAERLALADEWMAIGELKAAHLAIRAARDAGAAETAADDFDPADFAVVRFLTAAKLALTEKVPEGCQTLADEAIHDLSPAYRIVYLPTAIDLFLQGGSPESARSALETFRTLVTERGIREGRVAETLTIADAAVLLAEGRPYEVIELLDPFLVANPDSPSARKMLWLALDRTDQPRRALAALSSYLEVSRDDVDALRAAARASVERSPAKAADYMSRALRIRPDDLDTKLRWLDARAAQARAAGAANELSAINTELEPILAADPGNQAALNLRLSILSALGRSEEAEQALLSAEAHLADPVAAVLMRLTHLARSGQAEEADRLCERAVVDHPGSTTLRITRAQLQVALGRPEAARQGLEEAIAAFDGTDLTRIELALSDLLLSQGQPAEVVEHLRRIAAREPDNLRVRALLLDREEVGKNPEESGQLVDEMRRIEGDHGIQWKLEDVRRQLRGDGWESQRDAIVQTLQECLRRDPGWMRAAVMLGRVYESMGREDDALRTYESAYAVDPAGASVGLVDRLVGVLIRKARFAEAQRILSRIPEGVSQLRMHRVGVALGQPDPETAIEELRRRIQEDPTDADSMVLLATLTYRQSKDAERSLELLDRAAELSEDPAKIMQARVYVLHTEGRDQEAMALVDEHIELHNDRDTYLFRAGFFDVLERLEEAERDYRLAATMPPPTAEGHVALGDFLVKHTRADEAVEAWREASALDPENVGIELRLISVLISSAKKPKREDGLRRLDAFQRRFRNDPRGLYLSARAEIAAGSYGAVERASRSLEAAVQADPRFTPAHVELIRIAQRSGSPAKIEACLRAARRSGVQDPEIDLAEATLDAKLGKLTVAESKARTIIEQYPGYVPARLLVAGIKLQTGEPAAARAFVEQVLEGLPNNAQAIIARAEIMIAQGQEEAAITDIEAYCQSADRPAAVPVVLWLAMRQVRQGEFDAAESSVAKAERLAPESVDVARVRIDLLAVQKRFADISAIADRETSADAERAEIITRAASALGGATEEKYRNQALALFTRALAAAPDNPDLMLAMGQMYYVAEQVNDAVDAYRRLLDRDPDNAAALNDLAWIYATEMGKPAEGLKFADKGLRLAPADANLLDTRGVIHFMLGQLDRSRTDLEAGAELPSVPPSTRARTLFHLARTLAALGDHATARSRLEQARAIDESEAVFTEKEREEIADLAKTVAG